MAKIQKVYIMQGIPGSGKSTLALKMMGQAADVGAAVLKVSADDYFYEGSEYKFDASKLGEAHAQCLHNFVEWVRYPPKSEVCLALVDNTNIHLWEMSPYVAVAAAYGWSVEVHTTMCPVEMALARGLHRVPEEVLNRMLAELEEPFDRWGPHYIYGTTGK